MSQSQKSQSINLSTVKHFPKKPIVVMPAEMLEILKAENK